MKRNTRPNKQQAVAKQRGVVLAENLLGFVLLGLLVGSLVPFIGFWKTTTERWRQSEHRLIMAENVLVSELSRGYDQLVVGPTSSLTWPATTPSSDEALLFTVQVSYDTVTGPGSEPMTTAAPKRVTVTVRSAVQEEPQRPIVLTGWSYPGGQQP